MVTHTRKYRALHYPSKYTHRAVNRHTHREHTPRAVGSHLCCGAREQLGVWGPAQEHLVVVLKVERELYIYSPPPIIPARPRLELATFRLWVRLSTIRPRLPQVVKFKEVHDNQGYFGPTTSLWEITKRAAYLSINSSPSEVRLELHTPHCDTFALELAAVHVSARDSCF